MHILSSGSALNFLTTKCRRVSVDWLHFKVWVWYVPCVHSPRFFAFFRCVWQRAEGLEGGGRWAVGATLAVAEWQRWRWRRNPRSAKTRRWRPCLFERLKNCSCSCSCSYRCWCCSCCCCSFAAGKLEGKHCNFYTAKSLNMPLHFCAGMSSCRCHPTHYPRPWLLHFRRKFPFPNALHAPNARTCAQSGHKDMPGYGARVQIRVWSC